MDDIEPHAITGCGVLFLAFLHHQLGFTIPQIVAAAAPTMAGVFTNLTGMTDAWTAFLDLVNLHYPQDGSMYASPLDVFPVADLASFDAAHQMSWVTNGQPNVAYVRLTHGLPVDVAGHAHEQRPHSRFASADGGDSRNHADTTQRVAPTGRVHRPGGHADGVVRRPAAPAVVPSGETGGPSAPAARHRCERAG